MSLSKCLNNLQLYVVWFQLSYILEEISSDEISTLFEHKDVFQH